MSDLSALQHVLDALDHARRALAQHNSRTPGGYDDPLAWQQRAMHYEREVAKREREALPIFEAACRELVNASQREVA